MVKVILDCEQLPRPGIATLCSCAGREDWRLLGGTHACTGGTHCQQKMEEILRIKMKTKLELKVWNWQKHSLIPA